MIPQTSRTFRIFVSSTFSDLKEERNALQKNVFPRLRELCMQQGCRFQAIDLRWGVREEASLDQQTMKICTEEIQRCQRVTPRPNFIMLLGDRYGWCPLPYEILTNEFEEIERRAKDNEDKALLNRWYRCDDNAVPPIYCLQSRTGGFTDYANWEVVEHRLHDILLKATAEMKLADEEQVKYTASATEQEIIHGLKVPDANEHVFCFFRTIEDLPQDASAKDFIDLDEMGNLDENAATQLHDLKENLRDRLPGNIHEYEAAWTDRGLTTDHIGKLCEDVYNSLARIINKEIVKLEKIDPLDKEIADHEAFGRDRAKFFIGRTAILQTISEYVKGTDNHPLAVFGESGSGKSALMARAVEPIHNDHPNAEIIVRFIGVTPSSTDIRSLLESLCWQIYTVFDFDNQKRRRLAEIDGESEEAQKEREEIEEEYLIPPDIQKLPLTFHKFLNKIPRNKNLFLFLDALDQLSDINNARNLIWLPAELPEHVRLIASTLPGECLSVLEKILPATNIVELEPMHLEEGSALLDAWLKDADRTLQNRQREEVLSKFRKNRLPLYLKLAFEEARRWKSYTPLHELSPDIPGIICDLFARLSLDANHGATMVSRSLGYLAAAKNGLTEDELLDVLSSDDEVFQDFIKRAYHKPSEKRLPVIVWSRLYFDLEPYLTERSVDGTSLLAFFHRQLGEVVIEDYLKGEEKKERHCTLACYFGKQPYWTERDKTKTPNKRKVSELPYQQAWGGLSDELVVTLTDFSFMEAKLLASGTYPLIEDYDLAFIPDVKVSIERAKHTEKSLRLIQGALRLSAHVLAQDKTQLPGQLVGRLMTQEAPEIHALLEQIKKWKGAPWLRPLTPLSFVPEGTLHYTLTGHTGTVLSIAVTHDGNFAISGGADETLRVWDLKRWKMSDSLNLPAGIGNKMSGHFYGATALGGLQAPLSFQGEISAPTSMAVTPDGRYAIFSVVKDRIVWMWDIQKNKLAHILKGHTSVVYKVAVTPDAKHAVSGGLDGMVLVWNLHQGDERELHPVHIFTEHNDIVSAVEITKDGRYAVSGSRDKTIRVWDIENRKLVRTIYTGRPVLGLAVAHDTHRIISTSTDKAVYVWDINQGVSWLKGICRRGMLNTLKGHKGPIEALAVTPDGRKMISASKDGTLKIWDLERGKFLFNLAKNLFAWTTKIVVTPDGRYALTASDDQTIRVWNLNSLTDVPYSFDHASAVRAVAITPDGHLAISGSLDNLVKVWDLEERMMLHNLAGHTDVVRTVAVTPDGKFAVSGSGDNTIKVWDLKQGEEIHNLTGHNDKVNSVAVTGDGKFAVSVSGDNTVRVWDLNKGELLAAYTDHAEVGALAMTMDGNRALTASAGGSLRIWDLVLEKRDREIISLNMLIQEILGDIKRTKNEKGISLEELLNPEELLNRKMSHILAEHIELINTIAVTNEGSLAVSGGMNGSLRVWDLDEMKEIRTLGSGSKAVWSVSITPEGRPLLLTTEGRSLKIWDMEEWEVIASFTGDSDFLSCALARDGVAIVAGDTMGKVHILRLEELNGVK